MAKKKKPTRVARAKTERSATGCFLASVGGRKGIILVNRDPEGVEQYLSYMRSDEGPIWTWRNDIDLAMEFVSLALLKNQMEALDLNNLPNQQTPCYKLLAYDIETGVYHNINFSAAHLPKIPPRSPSKNPIKDLQQHLRNLPVKDRDKLNEFFDGTPDAILLLIEWTYTGEVDMDVDKDPRALDMQM